MYYKVISDRYIFQYRWPVLKTLYRKYEIFSKEKLTSTLKTFFAKDVQNSLNFKQFCFYFILNTYLDKMAIQKMSS